jgi:hypothetical protein
MWASVPADVLIQELQGESVLLNLRTGRYFGLDEVETRMWTVLTTAEPLRAAYDTLLAEYDVDGQRLVGTCEPCSRSSCSTGSWRSTVSIRERHGIFQAMREGSRNRDWA